MVKELPDFRILLVGNGIEKLYLQKLAESMGLGRVVFFAGFQENVKDWLSIMDVFIISSRTEGTPLALLEALATGLPIIATKVGEIPNILVDHQNGILVNYGDVKGLSESIVYLLNNPIKAKTLAEAGRQLVEQKYDVENWIQQIENIYWSVLNERSKRDSFRLTVAG